MFNGTIFAKRYLSAVTTPLSHSGMYHMDHPYNFHNTNGEQGFTYMHAYKILSSIING